MNNEIAKQADGGFGDVFSSGLPSMVGIVTLIAQPVVQARTSLDWPEWLPYVVAIVISGLLAYYRIKVVRRSELGEGAILMLLLTLVIFSAYVTGNNVVYYTKQGYSAPAASGAAPSQELESLRRERDLLKQKLEGAEGLIMALRQTMPGATGKPQTSVPSWLALLETVGVGEAWAQPPAPTPAPRGGRLTPQELQELLQKYDAQQRELDRKLREAEKAQGQIQTQRQPQPLLKSW